MEASLQGVLVDAISRLVRLRDARLFFFHVDFNPLESLPHTMRGLPKLVKVFLKINASWSDGKSRDGFLTLECRVELDEVRIDASPTAMP